MRENREFAKPKADMTPEFAPNAFKLEGADYMHPTPDDYVRAGYRPLRDVGPGVNPPGQHWERDGKITTGGDCWLWHYVLVDDPPPAPRVFSKLYLELALFKAGLLAAVDAFIDAKTITNDKGETMPLRRVYSTAITFSEENEYFAPFLAEAKQTLGVDDATAEAILAAAVEGGV